MYTLEVKEITEYKIDKDKFISIYKEEYDEFFDYPESEKPDEYEIEDFILYVLDENGVEIDGVECSTMGWPDVEFNLELDR